MQAEFAFQTLFLSRLTRWSGSGWSGSKAGFRVSKGGTSNISTLCRFCFEKRLFSHRVENKLPLQKRLARLEGMHLNSKMSHLLHRYLQNRVRNSTQRQFSLAEASCQTPCTDFRKSACCAHALVFQLRPWPHHSYTRCHSSTYLVSRESWYTKVALERFPLRPRRPAFTIPGFDSKPASRLECWTQWCIWEVRPPLFLENIIKIKWWSRVWVCAHIVWVQLPWVYGAFFRQILEGSIRERLIIGLVLAALLSDVYLLFFY